MRGHGYRLDRWARVAAMTVPALCVACGGGGGAGERALEVFRTTAAESPDARTYALEVASRSEAPAMGDYLLEAAGETAYDVSSAALHGLEERTVPGGVAALEPVFEEKRGALKVAAAVALVRQGEDGEALAWLRSTLTDDRFRPGPTVTTLLCERGEAEAVVKYLAKEATSDDERRRDEAYAAMGEIGTDWAKTMLLEGLDREHGARREQAILAIGETGDPALAGKILRFRNTQGLVLATLDALGRLGGDDAIAALREAVGHEETVVRIHAAAGLVRNGRVEDAAPVFDEVLGAGDVSDRGLLAAELADVDDPSARVVLTRLAGDEDAGVRLEAFRGLLRTGTKEDLGTFLTGSGDADYRIQAVALEGVGRFGEPSAVETTLEPLFDTENPYVRIAAAAAAVEIEARGTAG